MSNLLRKFTIQHMHKSHKQRVNKLHKMQTLKSQVSQIPAAVIDEEEKSQQVSPQQQKTKEKIVVTDNIVTILQCMGFNLEQIMNGFKIYKFQNEEDAINVMTRDADLGKFNHRFTSNKEDDSIICILCGTEYEEHIDVLFEKADNEEKKKKKKKDIDEKLLIKENHKTPLPQLKEIKFDQETIDFFSSDELCKICCLRNIEEKDEKMKFACGHRFCKECVVKYLKMKIKNGNVLKVQCLEVDCIKKFTDEEIRYFITDEKIWNKFAKFKVNQQKIAEKGRNYVNCPFPDCEEVMIIDPAIFDDFCLECDEGHQFCARCKNEGWHRPEECKKVDVIIK